MEGRLEFYVDGQPLDVYTNGSEFKITKQVSNLFQIGETKSDTLEPMKVPKTEHNTSVFKGLGLVGNVERDTMKRTSFRYLFDSIPVLKEGWLRLDKTDLTDYWFAGLAGQIDFINTVDDINIGDLDLQEIDHRKTVNNIRISIEQDKPYIYSLANFGGKVFTKDPADPNQRVLNTDYLAPGVKLKYLWDKIMEFAGFTYSGEIFQTSDFLDACITYPNAPVISSDDDLRIAQAHKDSYTESFPVLRNGRYYFEGNYSWNGIEGNVSVLDNWRIVIPKTGIYKIYAVPNGRVVYNDSLHQSAPYYLDIITPVQTFRTASRNIFDEVPFYTVELNEGDIIDFTISAPPRFGSVPAQLIVSDIVVTIDEASEGIIDFTGAFKDFPIKEFYKEICCRFGLVSVYSQYEQHITFYTPEERINSQTVINWTDKYVRRLEESYAVNSLRRNNILKHKYKEDFLSYNDGNMRIFDVNMLDSHVVLNSRIYSHDREMTLIEFGANSAFVPKMPLWEFKTGKDENSTGSYTKEYNPLNGRYYMYKIVRTNYSASFRSELLNSSVSIIQNVPLAGNKDVHFKDLTPKYYDVYNKIFKNTAILKIEMNLSAYDVQQLNFAARYYMEQEAAYFIFNKLEWTPGKTCIVEFFKISE